MSKEANFCAICTEIHDGNFETTRSKLETESASTSLVYPKGASIGYSLHRNPTKHYRWKNTTCTIEDEQDETIPPNIYQLEMIQVI